MKVEKLGFEVTMLALNTLFAEGAHTKQPKKVKESVWRRRMDAIDLYYLVKDTTYEGIGEVFGGITKERVRQIIYRGWKDMLRNASPETQQRFRLDELDLKKPRSIASRMRQSLRMGGTCVQVAGMIREGKAYKEIASAIPKGTLPDRRATIQGWGLELPYVKTRREENTLLAKNIKDEEDPLKLQRLLDRVRLGFLGRHSTGEHPLLLSLGRLSKYAGLHYHPSKIRVLYMFLLASGIPTGCLGMKIKSGGKYYFIATKDRELAIKAIGADETWKPFMQNPVSIALGPAAEIPSSTRILRSGGYRRMGKLLEGLGLNGKTSYEDITVTIFGYDGSFFYPVDREEEIKAYLMSKSE